VFKDINYTNDENLKTPKHKHQITNKF